MSTKPLPTEPDTGAWVAEYILFWQNKYWYRTEDDELEGPYDSVDQADRALMSYCQELGL